MDLSGYTSIQQSRRHPTRTTDVYRFVSTREVLDGFAGLGWLPASVREAGVRKSENRGYQSHLVRLRNPDFTPGTVRVGEAVPEIVLRNAHNGDSALHLFAGIFEKVCANGLMVQKDGERVRLPHLGFAAWMVESAVRHLTGILPGAFEDRARWQTVVLRRDELLAFADAAVSLRFDTERVVVDPDEVLTPRRREQADPSLWSVMNTVQENILRGGILQRREDGSAYRSRAVTSVDEEVRLNLSLWRLAANLEKAIN
jgi:hypothetical protein